MQDLSGTDGPQPLEQADTHPGEQQHDHMSPVAAQVVSLGTGSGGNGGVAGAGAGAGSNGTGKAATSQSGATEMPPQPVSTHLEQEALAQQFLPPNFFAPYGKIIASSPSAADAAQRASALSAAGYRTGPSALAYYMPQASPYFFPPPEPEQQVEETEERPLGGGLKRRKPGNPMEPAPAKEENRQRHNLSERRRRDRINVLLEDLRAVVPNCKSSKSAILESTTDYVMKLREQSAQLEALNKDLAEENAQIVAFLTAKTPYSPAHNLLGIPSKQDKEDGNMQQQPMMMPHMTT